MDEATLFAIIASIACAVGFFLRPRIRRRLFPYLIRGLEPADMRSKWDKQPNWYNIGCWILILLIFSVPAAILMTFYFFPSVFFSPWNPLI